MIWADLRLLEALQDAEVPPATLARMAHVLAAEEIWLERLQGRDAKGLEVWPAHARPQKGKKMGSTRVATTSNRRVSGVPTFTKSAKR
jgi:uncharacterized damage-inducible protein DinB